MTVYFVLMNPFRRSRFGYADKVEADSPIYFARCPLEQAENAQDTFRLLVATILDGGLSKTSRTLLRTDIFCRPAMLMIFGASIIFSAQDSNGSSAMAWVNFGALAVHSFIQVCGGVVNERRHRETWQLQRRNEEYLEVIAAQKATLDAMMAVVFPARVKISSDGEIQTQHGFEDVFGVNISALEDFPTEQGEHELQQVVDNAQASLVPLKHKMRLRPRMGPMVFVCNICAANDVGSRTVILGFEILESFETTAVA